MAVIAPDGGGGYARPMLPLARVVVAVVVFTATLAASAGEVRFAVPAGWSADAAEARSRQADLYAVDTRAQPAAEMTGMRLPMKMFVDDAFVRGFVRGLQKSTPSLVEVKHDVVDIGGVRSLRVIADVESDGDAYRQAYYLIPNGDATACVLFTVARGGFAARLASFDAIARTTRVSAAAAPASSR